MQQLAACAWCGAPRAEGGKCPRCGADYAKAEQIRTQGRAAPVAAAPVQEVAMEPAVPAVIVGLEDRKVDDPQLELKMTVIAPPAALLVALVFHFMTPSLQRIFFGMPVHELGHATTAWLCGFFAIPTFWRTPVWDERGFVVPLALAGALACMAFRAWRADKRFFVILCAALLVVQGLGTLAVRESTAMMLVIFGGDGMGMVLAVALMASFFFGKDTDLYKGATRWGLLAIGAAAFVDIFATWATALHNRNAIPFGENEGSGLSDPLRLLEEYRWTTQVLVRRYVMVGSASLLALAALYAWAVMRARRYAKG